MKKILVPTDFSEFADFAFKLALAIANKSGGEIILLHVMLAPDSVKIEANADRTLINAGSEHDYLGGVVDKLRQNLQKQVDASAYDKVSYEIRSGNIKQAILDFGEEKEVDFIVMGTHGESGYDAMFIGSNAEKVVRQSTCPVLTTRNLNQEVKFDHIVFGCDLESRHPMPIAYLKSFQETFNSTIHLVYVNTPADFSQTSILEEKARKFAQDNNINNYNFSIYCDYNEEDGIHHFTQDVKADLIVVASRKRKGFARLLGGSVSEGVVRSSDIPVLTIGLD